MFDMQRLKLSYEVKPYRVNQAYGIDAPEVYSQFGFTKHNGVDIAPGDRKEIRAPFPCEAYRVLWQPNGGGNVLTVLSRDEYEGPTGKPARVLIDYMHLKKVILMPSGTNYRAETGDIIAIVDNTGFSTGPHTHMQYRWIQLTKNGFTEVEHNAANNSFDPEPFRDGTYAVDHLRLSLLQKVFSLLKLQKGL